MAIDFPASPTLNDVFTVGNVTYVWDGTKWTASVTGGISLDKIEEGNTSAEVIDTGSDGRFVVTTEGTERLFVNSNGNISVGSSLNDSVGSTTTLTVDQTSGNGQISLGANGTVRGRIFADNSTGELRIGNPTAGDLMLYTNNTERLRINSAGLVGIGTSSPSTPLEVAGAVGSGVISDYLSLYYPQSYGGGGSGPRMLFKANDIAGTKSTYAGIWSLLHANTVGAHSGKLVFGTTSGGNLVERLRIDESGRVGIGNNAPGDYNGGFNQLVVGSSGDQGISIVSGTSSNGTIAFADGATSTEEYRGYIQYGHASDALLFATGGTERFKCDSSGRLLVGTSSAPTGGTYAINSLISVKGFAGSSTGVGIFNISGGMAASSVVSGTEISVIACSDASGNEYATIKCVGDGTGTSGDYPSRLVFSTTADGASSPTERMRITNSGYTIHHAPGWVLEVATAAASGTTDRLIYGVSERAAAGAGGGNQVFIVYSNGNVVNFNNSYGSISDIKLKENIVDAHSQWDDLKALQVRNYNFKEGQTHTQIGLVAQEVELVSPGLVSESPDRDEDGNDLGTVTKSVNYSVLYMKAVKALQEAMERIETLEGMVAVNNITIDEQQHQLSTLAARLTALESA
jgi:hypothetical protein